MQFPQIRMESQFAQISMTQTSAKLEISQPKAEIAMEQPKAEISIHTEPGKLTIDQTQAWEAMDLMNITRRNEKIAQKAIQDVLAGMERIARQGQELMQIENNGNPIVSQAIENGHRQPKSIGQNYTPLPFPVKINYEPARVQTEIIVNQPKIDVVTHKPEYTYHPGTIEIQMKQYHQLQIDYVNLFSDSI